MRTIVRLALAAALSLATAAPGIAGEYTQGHVKKIDLKQKKVTIRHEEMQNLDMPAMTMVFRVAEDAMLEDMAEGQTIEFIAERVNGKLTVVELK